MRELKKGIISILCSCTLFVVGCTNNLNENEEQGITRENTSISSENLANNIYNLNEDKAISSPNQSENKNSDNIDSKKQIYLEKLRKLESDLDSLLKEKYASPKTQDLIDASSKEYTQWDNMLNEIYNELQNQLSEEEMSKLVEEELDWINTRNEKSEATANKFKDGTIAPFDRIMSAATSTKERCYELVNQYMK